VRPKSSTKALMHFAKGGRTGFPHVMWVAAWLGAPLAQFVRVTTR